MSTWRPTPALRIYVDAGSYTTRTILQQLWETQSVNEDGHWKQTEVEWRDVPTFDAYDKVYREGARRKAMEIDADFYNNVVY